QGALPAHYRKGWEERARHGGSLIGEQVELPVRHFDGSTAGRAPTETLAPQEPTATSTPVVPPKAPSPAPAGPGRGLRGGLDSHWKP
ncbi:MAG: hypothetical protein J0L85_06825, partial [Zoogloea sp.]|nr:hypothetical protein [Zoogloea sp.]